MVLYVRLQPDRLSSNLLGDEAEEQVRPPEASSEGISAFCWSTFQPVFPVVGQMSLGSGSSAGSKNKVSTIKVWP